MSQFGSVGPGGKILEDGRGAPPENVHLLAHQAAVRTHAMASDFSAQAMALHEAAKKLAESADDSVKRSRVAHKMVLEANAPEIEKKSLEDRLAVSEARVAELEGKAQANPEPIKV